MKTTIALAGMLVSFNVAGAAVYEFTREPEPQPVQAQQPVQTKPKPAAPAAKPAAKAPTSSASPVQQQDAVAQTPDCVQGALCNDL